MPLVFASLLTVTLSMLLYIMERRTKFGELLPFIKQTIIGIIFGLSAAFATELGSVNIMGASLNARDAAPVTAGLLFGPWAGILTGIIGAIDRYFIATPIFGIGAYTQLACSVATLFAGILTAIIKVTLFKKHKPLVIHALVIILLIETFHMSMVPITHVADIEQATVVMVNCFGALLFSNSVAVIFAIAITSVMEQYLQGHTLKQIITSRDVFFNNDLFFSFQFWLLLIIILAFAASVLSTSLFLNSMSHNYTESESQRDLEIFNEMVEEEVFTQKSSYEEVAKKVAYYWSDEGEYSIMIVDKNNNIVTTDTKYTDIPISIRNIPENTLIQQTINGIDMLLMYVNHGDYKIVQYRLVRTEMFLSYLTTMIFAFIQIVIFGALMLCVFILLRKLVGQNLNKINRSLEEITKGNLDEKVDVYTHKEFTMLSNSINSTVDTLKDYIDREANRYNEEFELAHQIQLSALPNVFPPFPEHKEFDIYATYKSARDVGGDFYDYYFLGDGRLAIIIADVSGKGIPAAMFMMRVKMAFRIFADKFKDSAETLYAVNNYLCDHNDAGMFVTGWIGILDTKTGDFQVSNAGHNYPLLISDETTFFKAPVSLVLGGMENIKYKNMNTTLKPGDKLFLYTDGITEANDKNEKLYGDDRLIKCLENYKSNDVVSMSNRVIDDVNAFVKEAEQFDDMTTVSFIYKGLEVDEKHDGVVLEATKNPVEEATEFLGKFLEKINCPNKLKASFNICVDEIISNIVKHGYKGKQGKIDFAVFYEKIQNKCEIKLSFTDEAKAFNPLNTENPDVTLSVEERKIGGLGLYMVKNMMGNISYNNINNNNQLIITKEYVEDEN